MTRRASGLLAICAESEVEISEEDARLLGIENRTPLKIVSRRGEMQARAWINGRVPEGIVFGNFHFPGLANVNQLTINAVDPIAKIPEYKVCAVRVEPM